MLIIKSNKNPWQKWKEIFLSPIYAWILHAVFEQRKKCFRYSNARNLQNLGPFYGSVWNISVFFV